MTPIRTPIVIDHVHSEGKHKDDLKGCYFLPDGKGRYDFYLKNGNSPKASDLHKGSMFSFQFDGQDFSWTIHIKDISDLAANGPWSNTAPHPAQDETGTYTAQAGANVDAEAASSAYK